MSNLTLEVGIYNPRPSKMRRTLGFLLRFDQPVPALSGILAGHYYRRKSRDMANSSRGQAHDIII